MFLSIIHKEICGDILQHYTWYIKASDLVLDSVVSAEIKGHIYRADLPCIHYQAVKLQQVVYFKWKTSITLWGMCIHRECVINRQCVMNPHTVVMSPPFFIIQSWWCHRCMSSSEILCRYHTLYKKIVLNNFRMTWLAVVRSPCSPLLCFQEFNRIRTSINISGSNRSSLATI